MWPRLMASALLLAGFLMPGIATATEQPKDLSVVIETPAGRYYIALFGEVDGPVQIPVKDGQISALQISNVPTEAGVRVVFHAVIDEATYQFVTSQELPFDAAPESIQVELADLEAYGLEGWTLGLGRLPDRIQGQPTVSQ